MCFHTANISLRKYVILYDENMFFGVGKKKREIVSRARQKMYFFPHGVANIAVPSKMQHYI